MTKEEFKNELKKTGFDTKMFAKLLCFNEHTIYMWISGRTKVPVYTESILKLLVFFQQKNNINNIKNNPNDERNIEKELEYYKKVIALKKENIKLEEKLEKLKNQIKTKKAHQ